MLTSRVSWLPPSNLYTRYFAKPRAFGATPASQSTRVDTEVNDVVIVWGRIVNCTG